MSDFNRYDSLKNKVSKAKRLPSKLKRNSNSKNNGKHKSKSNSKSSIEYIVPENSPLRKNSNESQAGFYNSDISNYNSSNRNFNLGNGPYDSSNSNYDSNGEETIEFIDSGLLDYDDGLSNDSHNLDGLDDGPYFDDRLSNDSYFTGVLDEDFNHENDLNNNLNYDYENQSNLNKFNGSNDNLSYDLNDFPENSNSIFDLNEDGNNYENSSEDLVFDYESYSNSKPRSISNSTSGFNSNSKSKYSKYGSKSSNSIKYKINDFKNNLLNKDDESKSKFGKLVVFLIVLVLLSSAFYFFMYQPFQNELNLERNSKLNELNTLYKGPLAVHENAYSLRNQIESENDINELKSIDVHRYATEDWRYYHSSKIVSSKDNYGRVMLSSEDGEKDIIMSVQEANEFVKDNDAKVLSNVQFKKIDTIIVPISISRLQATGGLISVGSIVDIYSLSDNDTYDDYSDSNQLDSSLAENNSMPSENESQIDSADTNEELNLEPNDYDDSALNSDVEADVSGATVLAILRSKDSGVIDSSISQSNTIVKGNETVPYENTSSYSNDVEELLKASVFESYNDDKALESYLNKYGIKLANYERLSNLGDLECEYLVLLEVPRSDVSFVINNMDKLILTIPTEFAPNWAISELNSTYYENYQ